MTNTLALTQPNISGEAIIAPIRKRAKLGLRKLAAIALFVTTSFGTLSASFSPASGKNLADRIGAKIRQVKAGGQFRLLNIYNSLRASNPNLVDAMNSAKEGLASWYGGMFHGRKTAMGTVYNMNAMTAAHRTLPLGTWVRVTNQQNGRSAIVQVTDRGPYVANRIMDLSYAAATKLGYANAGTANIAMKVIGQGYDNASEAQKALDAMASTMMDSTTAMNDATAIPAVFGAVHTDSQNVSLATPQSDVASLIEAVKAVPGVGSVAEIFA
jgi:rare lipoprotein A (peptidoglycan hydrolase)